MKNILKKTLLLATTTFFLVGCSEEFLETSPSGELSVRDAAETAKLNPSITDSSLNGIYSMTINNGTGGLGGHNDYGHKAYDMQSDMLTGDMALTNNRWSRYINIVNLKSTTDYTSNNNYMPWRYYYRVIRSANLLIATAGGNDNVPETDKGKYTMGQAKAMRAYGYFYLAQFFTPEYDPNSKILPIYTDPEQPNQPQSTTKEVYDLMIKDLNDAITLLSGYARPGKVNINQNVAKGLLAYVYGAMGTAEANAKSKQLSDQIVASGEFSLVSNGEALGGFNDLSTPGWMWGVDLTPEIGLNLASWWGQLDIFTFSYAAYGDTKGIDAGLFAQIKSTDVRKTQFLNSPTNSRHLVPYNKFYAPARSIGGQNPVTTDYIYMRVAEFYLLSAEMSARTGDEGTAKSRLKFLLAKRFTSAADYAYVDGLSGQALLDEIYLQTRIELWGEGKSYMAMKRFKATTVRGSNHLSDIGEPIPYNDDRMDYEIPQSEIQNNPFISL